MHHPFHVHGAGRSSMLTRRRRGRSQPRLEGHGARSRRRDRRHPARRLQPGTLDGPLPHRRTQPERDDVLVPSPRVLTRSTHCSPTRYRSNVHGSTSPSQPHRLLHRARFLPTCSTTSTRTPAERRSKGPRSIRRRAGRHGRRRRGAAVVRCRRGSATSSLSDGRRVGPGDRRGDRHDDPRGDGPRGPPPLRFRPRRPCGQLGDQ